MIGLSLSFCIQDLMKGKVLEKEVDWIFTSTRFLSPIEAWCTYKNSYWAQWEQEEILQLLEKLWPKIIQPRLLARQAGETEDFHFTLNARRKFWYQGSPMKALASIYPRSVWEKIEGRQIIASKIRNMIRQEISRRYWNR